MNARAIKRRHAKRLLGRLWMAAYRAWFIHEVAESISALPIKLYQPVQGECWHVGTGEYRREPTP